MTRVITSGLPPHEPPLDGDPFRYGWRYVNRTLPDGQTVIEEVPLTLEDVLHPQEDDVIPENTQQARDRRYLADVLNDRYVGEPHILVLDDCLIDWGIPGLRPHSPDIGVLQGVRTKKGRWGTFSLRKEGGRPVLVIEIVSPQSRKNDVVIKVDHYHQVGVPLYVVVDWEREDRPRCLLAYQDTPQGYVEMPLDSESRVLLGPTGVLLGLQDDRVICYDQVTGKELGDYSQVCQQLREAEQRQQKAEQRQQKAEQRQRKAEQRQQKAEQRQREEAAARQAAEQRQREEAVARQAAEQRQREEAAARQAAEQRLRELEEQLRRIQENLP